MARRTLTARISLRFVHGGAAEGFQKSAKKARYEQLQAENMTAFSASQLPALLGKNLEGTRSIQRCEEIKIVLWVMNCGYATTYASSLVYSC